MKGWGYQKIGNFSEIGRGSSPRPIIDQSYFINGNIPWIKIADATASFKYIYKTKEYVNEYGASFSRKLLPGTLILAASGTLGFPIFLGVEGCIHDGWLYFKTIKKNVDKQYLYYCLITFIKSFNSVSYGAAIQNINTDILRNTEIPLPALPIQRKIAAILSAYDDLIENNNRRIAILEKMAEELYREWFVRLRFPGHENVKKVKGVPEGWEVKSALHLLNILGGGTPKTDIPNYWGGDIPFFTPKDAHDGYFANLTEKTITQQGLENCNSKLYPKNTIFITARGTVGKIVLSLRPMAMNQSCYALEPKSCKHVYYYFLAIRNVVDIIKGTSNSGVFDNIVTDSFKQFDLFFPDQEVISNFEITIRPIFKQIESKVTSKYLLTTFRDRLLSRLMSGKIDVENMDIQFPASMRCAEPVEAQEEAVDA